MVAPNVPTNGHLIDINRGLCAEKQCRAVDFSFGGFGKALLLAQGISLTSPPILHVISAAQGDLCTPIAATLLLVRRNIPVL